MAATTSSPHLAPANSSCQITGRPIPAPRHAPAVRIRSWRRFAASSSEVCLVPARLLRPTPRRRNALREKASPPPPPLVVRHPVRPPCRDSPEFGSLASQEQKAGSLDAEPSSDLKQESVISGGQDCASPSGDVASDSKLDELDVIGDAEEVEIPLCENGCGAVFGIYKDPEGSVMQFEVEPHEGEIINRSEASESDGSGSMESMSSRARAVAMEHERSVCVATNGSDKSSRFHFEAPENMGSSVLNGEVSVVWRNVPPWRSVVWSGFAALCGFCIVFVASKLIGSSRKAKALLPRKLIDMQGPEMKEDELDKGNLNVLRKGQEFPDCLLRKPLLDRKELMSNIRKAQDSRKWSVLSNSFCRKDVSIYDDASVPEIRRNVAEVPTSEEGILQKYGTKEKNGIVISQPINSTEEEVSASYSSQSYLDEVSNRSESNDITLPQDTIEGSMEQTVDLKNGAQIMNMSEKDQGNIGEIQVPDPTYSNKSVTSSNDRSMEQTVDLKNGAQIMIMSEKDQGNIGEKEVPDPTTCSNKSVTSSNDRNSVIYSLEKEAQTGSANVHISGPNSASSPASEFESKEKPVEICQKNIDGTQGIEPSEVFICEKRMIYTKDNAHELSTNLVSEPSDGFSISSSVLTKIETPLDTNVSGLDGVQEVRATRTAANVANTACCVEFYSHNAKIVGTEACKTPVVAETMTATSPQRNLEDHEDRRTQNVRSMQVQEPSISSGNGKQVTLGTENEHQERIVHNKTPTRMETGPRRALNNASTPSFPTSQEETGQHTFAEASTSEKKQERKKPRAHLPKKKGKLQKEVYNDKEAVTEQSEQGKPGTETVVDPTNHVQKTKRVPKKRQKKVQNEMQAVPAQNDVQYSSMLDEKNNRQHVKKARRKNPKNTFHNLGAQEREENLETTYAISSPDNATMDNMKPLGVADSAVETQFSKQDDFSEDQSNGSSPSMLRKEERMLNF